MNRFKSLILASAAVAMLFGAATESYAQPGKPSGVPSPASSVEYFLPTQNAKYNKNIQSPQEFFGFEIGERLADWGDITRYVEYLADKSNRVSVKKFGFTFERRQFMQVCITSPSNQRNLDKIRKDHLKVLDPTQSDKIDLEKMPLIVNLCGNIHGNEISGSQALLPIMFYYAAVDDKAVADMLENTIIVFTPGQNPDGLSRFAMWVNSTSSINHFVDRSSREYSEAGPSSRANHYWMDTNRDWLTAQFPEGQNLVKMYEYWMPNVLLDLHEMGASRNGLYYISPGDPDRTYKYIPQENQDLTKEIGKTTGKYLDSIGVAYYTGRGYDDFFIGKGACYGDIQGSVCILHELSSTRGHVRDFEKYGVHNFGETVRWHSLAACGVLNGSIANAKALKEYQKNFYVNAAKAAAADPGKGYLFDARGNKGIAFNFLENLLLHEIDVYPVKGQEGKYFVPFGQQHYYKIKGIFEDIDVSEYKSSHFYDISTWSPARAYNLNFEVVAEAPVVDKKITEVVFPQGAVKGGASTIGYAFAPAEYYTPYMIAALQKKGVNLQVATAPFAYKNKASKIDITMPAGTIVIPAEGQIFSGQDLFNFLDELAKKCGVDVVGFQAKKPKDFSLAEVNRVPVRNTRTALITDTGASQQQGSIWYLLDYRYAMNHSLVDFKTFNRKEFKMDKYDAIVFCGNINSQLDAEANTNLTNWVENGGTLIMVGGSHYLVRRIGNDSVKGETGEGISGLVLSAEINHDSPLTWGYDQDNIDVFQNNATVWSVDNGAEVVMKYAAEPYRSGYVSKENLEKLAGSPIVATKRMGKGCIIYIHNDFTYRSYWFGTNHILTNAILFGNLI
ncbi:MAG: hypothetical protein IKR30_03935 [Bacteroidales bacterium]|nr:hypothetical protein [Bacteroidales bacterium]